MSRHFGEDHPRISPDDAFGLLGNELRMGILQTLGEAREPLSFSDLRERVGVRDSGQFNYHLDQLVGHFIENTDDGYRLRPAGDRVIEAVLSGVVTETPELERTQIDQPCPFCGAPVELGYREGRVQTHCPECGGSRGSRSTTVSDWASPSDDLIAYMYLPPAGLRNRTPEQILNAAGIWTVSMAQRAVRGVCPQCSAVFEHTMRVCEDHDTTGGLCDQCDQQLGITFYSKCTNCHFDLEVQWVAYVGTIKEVVNFMIEHGIDPFTVGGSSPYTLEETIVSTDPLEARFTFNLNEEALSVTVDSNLTVVEVTKDEPIESS